MCVLRVHPTCASTLSVLIGIYGLSELHVRWSDSPGKLPPHLCDVKAGVCVTHCLLLSRADNRTFTANSRCDWPAG